MNVGNNQKPYIDPVLQLNKYDFGVFNNFHLTTEFDKECRQRYGEKTCILYQIDNLDEIYQCRVLDTHIQKLVEKSSFYITIPKMLVEKYTVVIIEQIEGVRDITSVHLPMQVQLSNPPIIQ